MDDDEIVDTFTRLRDALDVIADLLTHVVVDIHDLNADLSGFIEHHPN